MSTYNNDTNLQHSMIFSYIWRYIVKEEFLKDFEHEYGQNGSWVKLFKKSKSYKSTKLMKSNVSENTYVTIDSWSSLEEFLVFKKKYLQEFNQIDKRCEAFTLTEEHIGDFTHVD